MLELFEKNSFMILFHIDQLKTIRLESIEGSHRRGAMSLPSGLSGRCMGSHRLALINVDQHQDGIVEEMIQRKLVQRASLARMLRAYFEILMMCFCRLSGYSQESA
jgi:hypothetical protein